MNHLNPSPFLILCLLLSVLTGLCTRYLVRVARRWNLVKTNFTGRQLPDLGAAIWVAVVVGYIVMIEAEPDQRPVWEAFALVAFFTGLLGFIDDRFGDHTARGFRGHFGKLLEGHLTTGAAKALLIPPTAVGAAILALHQSLGLALLTAAVISLMANSFNMLDMRPGRAVTAWLLAVLLFVAAAMLLQCNVSPMLLAAGPVLVYFPLDTQLRAMMGDTGANLLGALLGLQFAVLTPWWVQAGLIGLLLFLQVYGEHHQQAANVIDSPWLKWLDLFTRNE